MRHERTSGFRKWLRHNTSRCWWCALLLRRLEKKKKKIPKWALLTPAPPAHLGVCNETSTLASLVPREYTHTDKRRPIFSNICRLGWERTNVKVPGQELWPVSKAISGTRCVVMFRSRVPGETRNLFFFFSCFIYSFFSPFSFSTAKRSTLRPFLTLIFFLYFLFTRFEKLGSVKKTKREKKRENLHHLPLVTRLLRCFPNSRNENFKWTLSSHR